MKIFLIDRPRLIITFTVIILLACIYPITQITINPDLESYLPESMASRANTMKIEKIFGESEPIIIIFETDDILNAKTLERIENLSRDFNRIGEFDRVYSLFDAKSIKGDYGFLKVDPLIRRIPTDPERTERLRDEIKENELAYSLIVSEDFRYSMMMIASDKTLEDSELMELIYSKLDEYPGDEKVYINAQPYMRSVVNERIGRDLMILLPVGILVMFVFLLISFREKRGVLLPISIVIISIFISMALLAMFGWELSLIGILIPIMMIAIANNYGIHVVSRYQELNSLNPEMSVKEITIQTISYLKKPVILTGLTTIIGILGLATHILIPARQMGVITSISIAIALLLSLTFIPAVLILLKKGKILNSFGKNSNGFIPGLLKITGENVAKHPKRIILIFSIFLLIAASGLFRFQVASDSNKVLPKKHSFNQALKIADENFGGIKIMQLLFHGDVREPNMMSKLDYYQTELEKRPEVGSVTSIAKIIRIMSRALNDEGDEYYDKIPDSYEAISQYLELYGMSGDPEDFEEFIDFNYTYALMNIQYKANNISTMNALLAKINELTKDDPYYQMSGGYSLIDKELSEAVVKGQYNSLIFAFLAILFLITIIFRSINAGLIGSFPLVFSVISTFGIMGWLSIELNIVTAIMSSISIGLGVDYTIHIFWRLKTENAEEINPQQAAINAIQTTGRGISINAFSVILGFSVLLLSAFPIVQSFAFLIIISVFLCLICAMLLIPALSIVLKPKFLINTK
ncbi:MAG: MMPL family transporter [Ignavibacteriaceae bacterium]